MLLRRVFKTVASVNNIFVFNETQQTISASESPQDIILCFATFGFSVFFFVDLRNKEKSFISGEKIG